VSIEAVFFDAGETLLSPNPSWSELAVVKLEERGHDVTVDRMRLAWRHVGDHFIDAADAGIMFSVSHDASKRFWTKLYLDQLEFLGIDDEGAALVLYETFSNPANYRLFDDSLPTVAALKERGVRVGIISNFESWLRDMLTHFDMLDLFEVVAISGELELEKPDPRIFEWALREMGTTPDVSLYVGDSPNFDAQPAHDLGMTGVLLDRHGRWTDLDAPYAVVSTLAELLPLIDGTSPRRGSGTAPQ
jgi:putative hydrolase of the HAD superfamily